MQPQIEISDPGEAQHEIRSLPRAADSTWPRRLAVAIPLDTVPADSLGRNPQIVVAEDARRQKRQLGIAARTVAQREILAANCRVSIETDSTVRTAISASSRHQSSSRISIARNLARPTPGAP